MRSNSPDDLERQLEAAKQEKAIWDRQAEIRSIKRSMRHWKPPTTTKLLMAYIFLNCTVIEAYSMVVMWRLGDISALYALISAVVTESVSFAVYAAKAYNETKQEELIRLERDKMAQPQPDAPDDGPAG